jgi:hypothetical protein
LGKSMGKGMSKKGLGVDKNLQISTFTQKGKK